MKTAIHLFSILLIFALSITSCEDSDNFSSDGNLKIDFTVDKINFDTVFTTVASPMQRFKIYNRNNKSISFETIELINAESNGFRINVNGQAGTIFHDEDLLKKDSLYITVDIIAPISDKSSSIVKDKISFTWNGNTQFIELEACALNAEIWDDKVIDTNLHLSNKKAYYIRGNITVEEGATLNIDKGTTLYFDKNGSLTINGKTEAKGTTEAPITFRAHRFDFADYNIPYDHVPNQWKGITVGGNSFNNIFENVRIRNSQYGIDFISSNTSKQKAYLLNTIIHNTYEYGISATNCQIEAVNCQISNSRGILVDLAGGNYSFLHCTIANYYEWHPRTSAALSLKDSKDSQVFPLSAKFTNSIIVGTFKDEVNRRYNKDTSTSSFVNCVIQASTAKEEPDFVNTQWNISNVFPFKLLNTEGDLSYSFELTKESIARDNADYNHAQQAVKDLRGISRFTDNKPDIGCYEWTN